MTHPTGFIMVPVPTYTPTVTCPKCNAQLPTTFNYCSFCGARLRFQIVLKICPKCQSRIPEHAQFCPECGQKQQIDTSETRKTK
ncbi:MAG TPA: zinc ribbon domain-containing protein [Candidatus Nanoarchaeia archaeon]|nr:zinc ribbon domain-containing protein [Candidatus Nanoarchaeia archaeon]